MQQGALNTNRILFIGIGARTPFGTTRTLHDNIPLTNPEGESSIEDIDLRPLEKSKSCKGPMRQVSQVWEVQFIFYRSCSGTSNFC
jgi:iron complex outermembrane receptor protein